MQQPVGSFQPVLVALVSLRAELDELNRADEVGRLVFRSVLLYHPVMILDHQTRFDGVFGDEEGRPPRASGGDRASPAVEPPLAGLFGAKTAPFRTSDLKSPAPPALAR